MPTARSRPVVSLIVSKDRPLQLDGLLQSIAATCADPELADWRVLYKASPTSCDELYRCVAGDHPWATLIAEGDFRAQVQQLVAGYEHVLFLVDDSCFVRPFRLTDVLCQLADRPDAVGFSLRLGRNTTTSYAHRAVQRLPAFQELTADVLYYRWPEAEYDFGYPIEVSSSVYRLADIGPLVTSLAYANPNTLESQLALAAGRFRDSKPGLLCFGSSVAFSNPLNRVQKVFRNRAAYGRGLDAQHMIRQYAQGFRVDVTRLLGRVPSGCHEEVPLPLILRGQHREPADESPRYLPRWLRWFRRTA